MKEVTTSFIIYLCVVGIHCVIPGAISQSIWFWVKKLYIYIETHTHISCQPLEGLNSTHIHLAWKKENSRRGLGAGMLPVLTGWIVYSLTERGKGLEQTIKMKQWAGLWQQNFLSKLPSSSAPQVEVLQEGCSCHRQCSAKPSPKHRSQLDIKQI